MSRMLKEIQILYLKKITKTGEKVLFQKYLRNWDVNSNFFYFGYKDTFYKWNNFK